ncbi:hypothetical protein [Microbispora sp. CA-102843]|uniref:hypothetical protein n=1 Tax=Microbispora sp. CA-102843 TaxID=3239952 RepID=UPI003D8A36C9
MSDERLIYKSEAGRRELLDHYRKVLDGWPVPAEHVRVPAPEGETYHARARHRRRP